MAETLEHAIHERRRLLGNPYAYMDELTEIQAVHDERKGLQNPYAHLEKLERLTDSVARFDSTTPAGADRNRSFPLPKKKKTRYTDAEIETFSGLIHKAVWQRRRELIPGANDPLQLLDPAVAFRVIGYEFEVVDALGEFNWGGTRGQVAGIIDNEMHKVQISGQFPLSTRNYTAAHELGHAMLHETNGLHRDRPMERSTSRPG